MDLHRQFGVGLRAKAGPVSSTARRVLARFVPSPWEDAPPGATLGPAPDESRLRSPERDTTMKKLMLDLDALNVDSFATTPAEHVRAMRAWSDDSVCPGTTTTGATARCPI